MHGTRSRLTYAVARVTALGIVACLFCAHYAHATTTAAQARRQARKLMRQGAFSEASTAHESAFDRSHRPSDLLAAAAAAQKAVQLDRAELLLRRVQLHRRATRAQRHQVWLHQHEITLIRQALASSRIDARERAAANTSRYFLEQLRLHNEKYASTDNDQPAAVDEAPAAQQNAPTAGERAAVTQPEDAGLFALTVAGFAMIGRALLGDDEPTSQRGALLITGGVMAGLATVLWFVQPRPAAKERP